MWGFTLIVAAAVLALIALSFVVGAPLLAVPIASLGLVGIGAYEIRLRRRQGKDLHQFREEARAESVDFTSRDRETLASE